MKAIVSLMVSLSAAAAMAANVIAVIPERDDVSRTLSANLRRHFPDIGVSVLPRETLGDINALKEFKIVISDVGVISPEGYKTLGAFVSSGGVLVGVGDFGKWLGERKNKPAERESEKLFGCCPRIATLVATRIRRLSDDPIASCLSLGAWIPCPPAKVASATELRISGAAIPLIEGQFQPPTPANGAAVSYSGSDNPARYGSYLTVCAYGDGLAIRAAESLFAMSLDIGLFKSLWRGLLEPEAYSGLKARLNRLATAEIVYENDSLVPNSGFEQWYRVSARGAYPNNVISGEALMPVHWRFNSWKGAYSACLVKAEGRRDDYCLAVSAIGDDARSGGAAWLATCDQTLLVPGKTYRASLMAKGEQTNGGELVVIFKTVDDRAIKRKLPLPTGSFDWRSFSTEFKAPRSGGVWKRGFTVALYFFGPGKLYADDIKLEEITLQHGERE